MLVTIRAKANSGYILVGPVWRTHRRASLSGMEHMGNLTKSCMISVVFSSLNTRYDKSSPALLRIGLCRGLPPFLETTDPLVPSSLHLSIVHTSHGTLGG